MIILHIQNILCWKFVDTIQNMLLTKPYKISLSLNAKLAKKQNKKTSAWNVLDANSISAKSLPHNYIKNIQTQNTFETEMPYVALQEYSQRQEYFILIKRCVSAGGVRKTEISKRQKKK